MYNSHATLFSISYMISHLSIYYMISSKYDIWPKPEAQLRDRPGRWRHAGPCPGSRRPAHAARSRAAGGG